MNETVYNKIYGPGSRVVCVENSAFTVMPSIGQIREGHILTCPKEHIEAIADLSYDQQEQVYKIMGMLNYFNHVFYQNETLFFEHGCSSSRGIHGAASITHAHLHSLPCSIAEGDKVLEMIESDSNNTIVEIEHFEELKKAFEEHESYNLLITPRKKQYMILGKEKWESQYLRRIAGEAFGNPNYDWKKEPKFEPELVETLALMHYYALSGCFCIM